jgi:hypothetical protein
MYACLSALVRRRDISFKTDTTEKDESDEIKKIQR